MDKKSKIIFISLAILFLIASFWKFYIFFIKKDYLVFDHIPCDPYSEMCFSIGCSEEDDVCKEEYYKKIEIKGYDYIECRDKGECIQHACLDDNSTCEVELCSADSVLEEGESCYNLMSESIKEDFTVGVIQEIENKASSTGEILETENIE